MICIPFATQRHKMNTIKDKYRTFVRQRGKSDCGVACLLTIIRLNVGDCPYDTLRIWSSTSEMGTSVKGLKEAANQAGLMAEAYLVDNLNEFKNESSFPCIIHVINRQNLPHFSVCCGISNDEKFLIFDPAVGFELWNESILTSRWKSKVLLLLSPSENFIKVRFT